VSYCSMYSHVQRGNEEMALVKAMYQIIGPSGELGYEFTNGTVTLRGIYEIK